MILMILMILIFYRIVILSFGKVLLIFAISIRPPCVVYLGKSKEKAWNMGGVSYNYVSFTTIMLVLPHIIVQWMFITFVFVIGSLKSSCVRSSLIILEFFMVLICTSWNLRSFQCYIGYSPLCYVKSEVYITPLSTPLQTHYSVHIFLYTQ